jgi:hypothetical protein
MKRRIEILIDIEVSDFQFEFLRQVLEDTCWKRVKVMTDTGFVQANEVEHHA